MSNTKMSSNSIGRNTLRLKVPARPSPRETKTPPILQPQTSKSKPGARWDDEYKNRMQADMDALVR